MSDSNRDPSPNSNTNQRTFRELSTEEQYVHQETNLRALGGRDDMPEFGGLSPVHENDGYRDGDIEHEPPLPEDYNPSGDDGSIAPRRHSTSDFEPLTSPTSQHNTYNRQATSNPRGDALATVQATSNPR